MKIGPVDPEITLLKGLFLKRNKNLTHAELIARGACMPRGLNMFIIISIYCWVWWWKNLENRL